MNVSRPPVADRPVTGRGFTLVEVLIVIVIIGVVASIAVFAVREIRDRGEGVSCATDREVLETAVEAYVATTRSTTIPASGTGDNRYERELVAVGYLSQASAYHNIDASGIVTSAGGHCP